MSTFIVTWEEAHTIYVEADDEESAIEKVSNGNGTAEKISLTSHPQATEIVDVVEVYDI